MFIFLLFIVSVVYGIKDHVMIDVVFEIKGYNNPFYYIGMSFIEIEENEYMRQEFVIGLFFVNILMISYKEKDGII